MLLSAVIAIPFLGALVLFLRSGSRRLALAIAGIPLVLLVWLVTHFDPQQSGIQYQTYWEWIPQIGLNYSLGLDGISLLMVGLNALLTFIAILSAEAAIKRPALFYGLILLTSGAVHGAFLSQNLLLFFLFYELVLIPMYLLICIWGSARGDYAGIKFLIYTAVSSILVLGAFLAIGWLADPHSFELSQLHDLALDPQTQTLVLVALILGFGIKMP